MSFSFLKKQEAFTLIEVMVVVFLVVSFTALGIGYNRSSDDNITFFKEQGVIVSEIYKVRSSVLASYTGDDVCALGIAVSTEGNTLNVFAQGPPVGNNTCPDFLGPVYIFDTSNVLYPIFDEDKGIQQSEIVDSNFEAVLFVPPYLEVKKKMLAGYESDDPCFTIQIGSIASGIEINNAGQVSVVPTCQ